MPRKARKAKQELIEQEGRIQCAINDLKNKKIPNPCQAALIYNLPPQTLYDRLKGLQSQAELRNHRHRLSLRQEEVLVAWIVLLDIRGAPPQLCTPHTVCQIHRNASSVEKLLKNGSKSPSSPSKRAFDELVKGCELAMYNAALLAKENSDLRAAIENYKQKKSRSKSQMTPIHGIPVQEAGDLILLRNEQLEAEGGGASRSAIPTSTAPKRALPTCSEYNIKGHTPTRCPSQRGFEFI